MLKILFLTDLFPNHRQPTEGLFNLSRAKALRNAGCEIRVIAPVSLTPPTHLVFPYPRIHQIRDFFIDTTNIPFEEQTHGFIVLRVKWIRLPDRLCWRFAAEVLHISIGKVVKSVVKDFNPDAVITSWLNPFGTYAKFIKRYSSTPVLAIAEGSDILVSPQKYGGWKRIERLLNQYCDTIVFVSNEMREVADRQFNIASSTVIKNGYEHDLFYFSRDKPKKTEGKQKLLSIGQLKYVKGHDILLQSLVELGDRCELALIGDGELRNEYKTFVSSSGLSHRVNFVGTVRHSWVKTYLDRCDLFCMPSRSEGLPIVALEAMACGVPVVATDVGGLSELIMDGFNGYLCDPGSPTALAQRIRKAANTNWDHRAIADWAKQNYGWDRFAEQMVEAIKGCIVCES